MSARYVSRIQMSVFVACIWTLTASDVQPDVCHEETRGNSMIQRSANLHGEHSSLAEDTWEYADQLDWKDDAWNNLKDGVEKESEEKTTETEKGLGSGLKWLATESCKATVQNPQECVEQVNKNDDQEVGKKALTAITHDVGNHQLELCLFEISKEGIASHFPNKCRVGVTCGNCKVWKVEIMVGASFCGGVSARMNAEGTIITPPQTGTGNLADIGKSVFGDDFDGNGFEAASLESIAVIGGWRRYSLGVQWKYSFKVETTAGVGAKFDARLGWDLCKAGWKCLGVDGGIKKGIKVGGKLFVCAKYEGNKHFLKIEAGVANLAAEIELTFITGVAAVDPPKFTPSNMRAHVVVPGCMAEPGYKSKHQVVHDGWCPLVQSPDQCNSNPNCYWAKPSDRKEFCFATKAWKDQHPGQQDGSCIWLGSGDCLKYDHCAWDYDPCMSAPCKTLAQILAQYWRMHGSSFGGFNGDGFMSIGAT